MAVPPETGSTQTYKVKLASGRVLGPIDLGRIRLLILKNQITGVEVAREYPKGEWKDINQIPEIAELFLANADGSLKGKQAEEAVAQTSLSTSLPGATQVLSSVSLAPIPELPTATPAKAVEPEVKKEQPIKLESVSQKIQETQESTEEKTVVGFAVQAEEDERTRVEEFTPDLKFETMTEVKKVQEPEPEDLFLDQPKRDLAQEKTVVFQRSSENAKLPGKKRASWKEIFKAALIALVVGSVGYDFFLAEPVKPLVLRSAPIRPKLPEYIHGKSDPEKSMQIYRDAMKYYLQDSVTGYKTAADRLRQSAAYDIENVKALAMLASTYINLIDSSNKDENYFSVISKLIDMSRAKNVDLSETVIADVEFFLTVNKAEAAQNRIVEYTKSHPKFGLEMFYYLALAFYYRGDATNAAKYIGQYPDNKAFSAKIFYLRGLIAEKLNDTVSAMSEYEKATKFNPEHAKSHLRIATLLNKAGKLKESGPHLDILINHPDRLAPRDAGAAFYLHCQLSELYQKWDLALGDVERAVKLDPDNHDYLLELYTLRAKAGESLQTAQKQARMYYFLGEGEKLIQLGKYQDAMVPLLQARQANDESPLPLIKIGDMFSYLHDIGNAKVNYRLASERAPNNIQVWSKYIDVLIQSYEWEDAKKAMDKFRNLPVSQSAIDKAAADMYQKQGHFVEAQTYYRKAMARDTIDPAVYIAYAKSLMSTKNFKDAPFFFALALRLDPLNVDAIISTAKCVAETESIDRAISALQDEIQKGNGMRAEYLSAIAELQIQKGAWDEAQKTVEQAIQANPEYASPWNLQGQIYLSRETQDKEALNKALLAYKSYSERNASDPTGYLERYKIFIKKAEFEKAKEELNHIYEIYPKFPNLHYYLGNLYAIQGNHVVAAEEFRRELTNTPDNSQTLIALGKELMEAGQAQEALKHFTKAMQLAPGSADAKQNAGWANFHLKNYLAAVSLVRAALVIDKANPTLFKRLGLIYKEMGDASSACSAFRKYLEMEPDAQDKAEFSFCF